MGCAGEVSLLEDKDNDFSKYGIAIKVKFRSEEDLQVLTTHRQSGGERNVSTMLYLMALQDIASSPFRAVDEINQGMDPVNERRIFNLVVSLVSNPGSTQYFILTPKILKNLNYYSSVKVHIVANGAEMNPFHQWRFSRFLNTATSMYEEEEREVIVIL
ncbi:structural maintenance of chromosomes protein 5-like [Dysidea avara]|uniref:structural maintenance of chromosomes protein 5-like n=1 Tax=Dysidea avara TaxID=196820 RepID=UPI003318A4E4